MKVSKATGTSTTATANPPQRTRKSKQGKPSTATGTSATTTADPELLADSTSSSSRVLPNNVLVGEVLNMITSKDKAQVTIIQLMLKYDFSPTRLKDLLLG